MMRLLAPSNFECQELVQACTGHWKAEMFEAPMQAQQMMRCWSSEWRNVWVLVTQHSQSGQILCVQEFGKHIASHRQLNSSDGKLDVAVCQQTFTRRYLRFQLWRTFWFTLNMINKYKQTITMCHHSIKSCHMALWLLTEAPASFLYGWYLSHRAKLENWLETSKRALVCCTLPMLLFYVVSIHTWIWSHSMISYCIHARWLRAKFASVECTWSAYSMQNKIANFTETYSIMSCFWIVFEYITLKDNFAWKLGVFILMYFLWVKNVCIQRF